MKDSGILVDRYTKSLYDLALVKKNVNKTYNNLKLVSKILKGASSLASIALSTNTPLNISIKFWNSILKVINAKPLFKNFVHLLIKNKRTNLFFKIVKRFKQIKLAKAGIKLVYLKASIKLKSSELMAISQHLEKTLATKIKLITLIDENLIGGFIIKFDSYVLDLSLKTKLESIESKLLNFSI